MRHIAQILVPTNLRQIASNAATIYLGVSDNHIYNIFIRA